MHKSEAVVEELGDGATRQDEFFQLGTAISEMDVLQFQILGYTQRAVRGQLDLFTVV